MSQKFEIGRAFLYVVAFMAMVTVDIITKLMVVSRFSVGETLPVIRNILNFTYIRNTGAAFGIFHQNTAALAVASILILVGVAVAMYFLKPQSELVKFAVCLVAAGAVGNLIDRIRLGYVVDFLDLQFVKFAIFNLADCFVCIGAFLLSVYVFTHNENKS